MESTAKILRKSIHTFLKNFHYFSTTPALLLLPFSASAFFSEALLTSSASSRHVFNSELLLLDVNLSQTMFVYLLSLPFTLASFLMAKASIIQALNHHKPALFRPLLSTHLSSLVLITTFNMGCFFIFTFAMNFLGSSSSVLLVLARIVVGAVWTNMYLISNLALVVAGMEEDCKGFAAVYKACLLLRKGKHSVAISVVLPTNLGVAAIEALFRFRILQVYHSLGRFSDAIALEGVLIAYLYSLLVVLETIACCLFYKNCESSFLADQSDPSCCYDIENLEVLPCIIGFNCTCKMENRVLQKHI